MSHGLSPVSIKDVPSIVEAAPYDLPTFWKVMCGIFILFGAIVFFGALSHPEGSKHAWVAFHVNFLFWFILSAASTGFSSALQICNAQWARPIRRLFESSATFFLISPIFLVIMYLGGAYNELFVWSHEAVPGKENWLTPNYVYLRDIVAMLILIFVSRRVVYFSIRRDIGAIRSGLTGVDSAKLSRWSAKCYDRYVTNWGSDAKAEIKKTSDAMGMLSPVVVILYAYLTTLVTFDQLMSVDPHWYSTMFGGFIFMSGVYVAMAWCSMLVGLSRGISSVFVAKIERRTLHDLGKLLFGFGIFWAYLFWSQYLPIWYGNMPEETEFLIIRLREQPWHDLAWMVLGCCFIIPFMLGLSRDVKQHPPLLFCTGMIVACGIWLQHYLLFAASLYPHEIPFDITEVGVTMGFLGIYLLCANFFLSKAPLIPFGDFYQTSSEPAH